MNNSCGFMESLSPIRVLEEAAALTDTQTDAEASAAGPALWEQSGGFSENSFPCK